MNNKIIRLAALAATAAGLLTVAIATPAAAATHNSDTRSSISTMGKTADITAFGSSCGGGGNDYGQYAVCFKENQNYGGGSFYSSPQWLDRAGELWGWEDNRMSSV